MRTKKGQKSTRPLDTLAQLGTEIYKEVDNQAFEDLAGQRENKAVLLKRARRNYIKNALSIALVTVNETARDERVEIATKKGAAIGEVLAADNQDKDIMRSYWNMYHCSSTLVRKNNKVSGRYCKNRLCLVCNSIRAAVSMNSYKPIFDSWGDESYFVTLTAPTIEGAVLGQRLDEMHKIFNGIKEFLRKRAQRGKGAKFEGVRKLECTYRPQTDKFHPHFHFLIRGKENANLLLNEWIARTKHLGTSYKAQDCRKADKDAAIEVFKYFTKVVSSSAKDKRVFVLGLDRIFKEFRGRRVIQNFGFKLPKENKKEVVLSLADKSVQTFEELQPFLMEYKDCFCVITHEFRELIEGKDSFVELLDWVDKEQTKGTPLLTIERILIVIDKILQAAGEYEERFRWSAECTDWISEETGEFLTDFRPSDKDKKAVKNFIKYKAKD